MATPQQPPLTPDQRLALEQKQKFETFALNAAIAGAVICPVVAFMPPRKLDMYTFSLAVGFYLSADHLATHYTGRGIFQQWKFAQPSSVGVGALPTEKARETQARFAEEKKLAEAREAMRSGRQVNWEEKEKKERSVLQKLWMGDETEGWKERRLEEERKALEEGKSYTDLILEQVWDVWNWDKKKSGGEEDGSSTEEKK
ncbi:hypothetical protein BU24DRAFT_423939 [Aaosphaeria arxii CBS 175.79]|uniref:Uncharacterized protein n=1 Tax=Aaosphaeria arxii CBS 175.79 TaxID=1450172 RepID=A0A6A5XQL3_9PLEO|nr:uncharacterized protein BU24DRAFT_423939 [Aaosphaeria arxii CBS 175.79]KAF2015020.1 hypothetical protein BU24DRAFT_423939 [Aaosphaeria arxii CBS 175.79]